MKTIIIDATSSPKLKPGDLKFQDCDRWDGTGDREFGEYVLEAIGPNNIAVGRLDYSYNSAVETGLHIDQIDVDPDWQRRGVGTMLVQELQRLYPNETVDWGLTTPQGDALRRSLQAMPVLYLKNDPGEDNKGNVDLHLEKLTVTRDKFMKDPQNQDFVFRPRGWYGTDANWQTWQQYITFTRRILLTAFGTDDPRKLTMLGDMSDITPTQMSAARKAAKMFMRMNQQVLSSQELPKDI